MNIQMVENFFPQGIAAGRAFLGRDAQIKWLSDNIHSNHHTLLLAPRRFGKTSLVLNTLNKIKLPYAEIDLHLAVSAKSVEKKILSALAALLKKASRKDGQILTMVQGFFKRNKAKWSLGFKGVLGVELEADPQKDSPENILMGLKLIDHVLGKKKKRAVLFIDEFQEIHRIDEGRQLQGAIRHFAQMSKNLVLIFSGSNRKMLTYMFDDKSQPMYELCDRILLDRIAPIHYKKYINQIAMKTWGKVLPEGTVDKIMILSERHPKRIYNLCYYLWRLHADKKTLPQLKDVAQAWEFFVNQRIKGLRYNLSKQSSGQIKVLSLIANNQADGLTSKAAQKLTKMAGSSILKAIHKLDLNDYIERDDSGKYQIIDPLICYVLQKREVIQ
jgi:uncharacterized protein